MTLNRASSRLASERSPLSSALAGQHDSVDIALFSPLSLAGTFVLLAGTAVCASAAVWLIRQRRRRGHSGGVGRVMMLAIGGTFAVAAVVSATEEEALDLNPAFSAADLTGTWQHGGATLMLALGGAYTCTPQRACGALGTAGRWAHLLDFELIFRPAGGTAVVERVVLFRGEQRLTQMEHIDFWTRKLTFRHVTPAS